MEPSLQALGHPPQLDLLYPNVAVCGHDAGALSCFTIRAQRQLVTQLCYTLT